MAFSTKRKEGENKGRVNFAMLALLLLFALGLFEMLMPSSSEGPADPREPQSVSEEQANSATLPVAPVVPVAIAPGTAADTSADTSAESMLGIEEPRRQIEYTLKIADVFERKGRHGLAPRAKAKPFVRAIELKWIGADDSERILVQVSKSNAFLDGSTASYETKGSQITISSWRAGSNYWRISRDGKVWSASGRIEMTPRVARGQIPELRADSSELRKSGSQPAVVHLNLHDSVLSAPVKWILQGSRTKEFRAGATRTVFLTESRLEIPLHELGRYYFRARSVSVNGEISALSATSEVNVLKEVRPKSRPIPRLARSLKSKPLKQTVRDVAAVDNDRFDAPRAETTTRLSQQARTNSLDEKKWSLAIEAASNSFISSEQTASSGESPSSQALALRVGYRESSTSLRIGYLRQVGASNAAASSLAYSRFELEATRWWQTGWRPLSIGATAGYENSVNADQSQFSPGYQVAKAGLGVALEIGERWTTGGQVLVGAWANSDRLAQIGGFAAYDITRDVNLGIGYRVSLFEAGAAALSRSSRRSFHIA